MVIHRYKIELLLAVYLFLHILYLARWICFHILLQEDGSADVKLRNYFVGLIFQQQIEHVVPVSFILLYYFVLL